MTKYWNQIEYMLSYDLGIHTFQLSRGRLSFWLLSLGWLNMCRHIPFGLCLLHSGFSCYVVDKYLGCLLQSHMGLILTTADTCRSAYPTWWKYLTDQHREPSARGLLKSSPSSGRAVGPRNEKIHDYKSRCSGRIWQDLILGGKDGMRLTSTYSNTHWLVVSIAWKILVSWDYFSQYIYIIYNIYNIIYIYII